MLIQVVEKSISLAFHKNYSQKYKNWGNYNHSRHYLSQYIPTIVTWSVGVQPNTDTLAAITRAV